MRKKICIVTTIPFALLTHMRAHIEMLAEQNDVTLIANGRQQDVQPLLNEHVHFIHVDIDRQVSLVSDWRALYSLFMIFRAHRFDVVHTLLPKAGLLGMLASFVARVPARIHTFTGQVWANKTGIARSGLIMLDKVLAWCSTGLLTDSHTQRTLLIEYGIAQEDQIEVLGNGSVCGVDVKRFQRNDEVRKEVRAELGIPDHAFVYLFLGRVNPDKGVHDLAHAFVNVQKKLPDTHLLVVGPEEGGMDSILEKIAEPCASHYHRISYTNKPEAYMSAADLFCMPSYREGFGSVIIEAAAASLPAIVSNIYGLMDAVIEGKTGLVHEVKNREQIEAALLLLTTNHELRLAMAKNATQRANAEFSQELVTGEMRRYYRALFTPQ